jgi:hypothetical protein
MECRQIKIYLEENFLVSGFDLSEEISAHLDECRECRNYYEELVTLGNSLIPMNEIAMVRDESKRFEENLAKALEAVDNVDPASISENRIVSLARLALAAAAVLVIMVVSYNPQFSSKIALLENTDAWQPSNVESEDMAQLIINGDTEALSVFSDESVVYLTETIPPRQAEVILESVTTEELEWLMENMSMEI